MKQLHSKPLFFSAIYFFQNIENKTSKRRGKKRGCVCVEENSLQTTITFWVKFSCLVLAQRDLSWVKFEENPFSSFWVI